MSKLAYAMLFAALLSTSCAAVRYDPVATDMPPPRHAGSVCAFGADGKPAHLDVGQSCWTPVHAKLRLTRTPIEVREGEAYEIRVPDGQEWYDATIRNIPPRGDKGSWLVNLFKGWRQVEEADWFALIGVVAAPQNVEPPLQLQRQDISADRVIRVRQNGQLGFYPNDAIIPQVHDFYGNNHGQIWVIVERVPSA